MKRETLHRRRDLANGVMYYIFRYIDSDINLDILAKELGSSRFHMQRVFKEEFGQSIYASIKSIRLQKAASLLLTNRYATITEIASMCGYGSQSAFIKAFKPRFGHSPKTWRRGGYEEYAKAILSNSEAYANAKNTLRHSDPVIVKRPDQQAFYLRHSGYDRGIAALWQQLQTWLWQQGIEEYEHYGIHHDNPVITPLGECRYIAAVALTQKPPPAEAPFPRFTIPGGVYAKIDASGSYGDVLHLLEWLYHAWLPQSGFETTTLPGFARYKRNHFLQEDGRFELEYFLPVQNIH